MRIGKKDRFKNWQLCGVWKIPFCDHGTTKPSTVLFALPIRLSISLFRLPAIVSAIPRYLGFSTCTHWPEFLEIHNVSVFLVLFHARLIVCSWKPIKCKLKTLIRSCMQCQIIRSAFSSIIFHTQFANAWQTNSQILFKLCDIRWSYNLILSALVLIVPTAYVSTNFFLKFLTS